MVKEISMLTGLVEKYDIYIKQRDVHDMLMVIVAQSLILILTVVSGIQQKSDICQIQTKSIFKSYGITKTPH